MLLICILYYHSISTTNIDKNYNNLPIIINHDGEVKIRIPKSAKITVIKDSVIKIKKTSHETHESSSKIASCSMYFCGGTLEITCPNDPQQYSIRFIDDPQIDKNKIEISENDIKKTSITKAYDYSSMEHSYFKSKSKKYTLYNIMVDSDYTGDIVCRIKNNISIIKCCLEVENLSISSIIIGKKPILLENNKIRKIINSDAEDLKHYLMTKVGVTYENLHNYTFLKSFLDELKKKDESIHSEPSTSKKESSVSKPERPYDSSKKLLSQSSIDLKFILILLFVIICIIIGIFIIYNVKYRSLKSMKNSMLNTTIFI